MNDWIKETLDEHSDYSPRDFKQTFIDHIQECRDDGFSMTETLLYMYGMLSELKMVSFAGLVGLWTKEVYTNEG